MNKYSLIGSLIGWFISLAIHLMLIMSMFGVWNLPMWLKITISILVVMSLGANFINLNNKSDKVVEAE